MAIYIYKCKNCGHIFEFLKIRKDEKVICPECGSENVERQISAPGGFKFVGPGFYKTDYGKKNE